MALDSTATLKVRKQQSNAFKIPRKHFQPKPTYPAKLSIRYDERIKDILRHTWSQKIYLRCTFPKNPSKCGRESKRRKIWDSETRESAKQEPTKTKTLKAFQDGSEAAGPKSSQFTLKIIWGLSEESWEKNKNTCEGLSDMSGSTRKFIWWQIRKWNRENKASKKRKVLLIPRKKIQSKSI